MKIHKLVQGELSNNVFVVESEKTCILIDPGLDQKAISNWLNENNFHPQAILLTHGHFDHIASTKYFQNKFNCQVYLGKEDQFYLDDPFGPLGHDIGSFARIETNFSYLATTNSQIKIKNIVVKMIKTPGHTPGSTCYYFPQIQTVFTGDTLFYRSIGRTDFAQGSLIQIEKSIKEKLYSLDSSTIVWPGHGQQTTIDQEIKQNKFIK